MTETVHTVRLALMVLASDRTPGLALSQMALEEEDISLLCVSLQKTTLLSSLTLNNAHLEKAAQDVVNALISRKRPIHELGLSNNHLKTLKVQQLFDHEFRLKTLDLSQNRLGRSFARSCADGMSESIDVLNLNLDKNPTLGDDSCNEILAAVAQNTSIREITMNGCGMKRKGFLQLAAAIKNPHTQIVKISATGNNLESVIAYKLGAAIGSNRTLTSIDLAECNISDYGIFGLIDPLGKNLTLESLCLKGNRFGEDVCEDLSNVFRKNFTLKTIEFQSCEIGKGFTNICPMGAVTSLDVSGNGLNGTALLSLTTWLKDFKCPLISLNVSNNDLGDFGVKEISSALRKNVKLEVLDVSDTLCGDSSVLHIIETITYHNMSLKRIKLLNNNISGKSAVLLSKMLDVNFFLESVEISNQFTEMLLGKLEENNLRRKELAQNTLNKVLSEDNMIALNLIKLSVFGNHFEEFNTQMEVLQFGDTSEKTSVVALTRSQIRAQLNARRLEVIEERRKSSIKIDEIRKFIHEKPKPNLPLLEIVKQKMKTLTRKKKKKRPQRSSDSSFESVVLAYEEGEAPKPQTPFDVEAPQPLLVDEEDDISPESAVFRTLSVIQHAKAIPKFSKVQFEGLLDEVIPTEDIVTRSRRMDFGTPVVTFDFASYPTDLDLALTDAFQQVLFVGFGDVISKENETNCIEYITEKAEVLEFKVLGIIAADNCMSLRKELLAKFDPITQVFSLSQSGLAAARKVLSELEEAEFFDKQDFLFLQDLFEDDVVEEGLTCLQKLGLISINANSVFSAGNAPIVEDKPQKSLSIAPYI